MLKYKTNTIEETESVYSILRERYNDKQIDIEFNYNTKEYTLSVTNKAFKQDPNVPLDLNIEVVYGDSVTGDTPLLLKKDGLIYIETIESIFDETKKVEYPGFKMFDKSIRIEKEYAPTDYTVWTDAGWVNIKKVIRHKCDKKIYRVLTDTGCVDVTEDHSLITSDLKNIKPKELKIGDSLLHSFPNEFVETVDVSVLTEKEAKLWGFFMAYGNCNENSWTLRNSNLERLTYFKDILEKVEPISFTISKDTLVPIQDVSYMVEKYKHLFYTVQGTKRVPNCILNASKEIKLAYLKGCGIMYTMTEKIKTQCMYYLMKSVGYEMYIDISDETYMLSGSMVKRGNETVVKKIIEKEYRNDYVYDLETDIGRFGCGIGQIQTTNTDSIFIRFKYNRDDFEKNRVDTFKLATLCGNNLTDVVFDRPPIVLEFEKVFNPFILLTKKRYIAKKYENMKDPFYLKGIDAKGIALTRRDYCLMVKKCYREIIDTIMDNSNKSVDVIDKSLQVFKNYIDRIHKYDIALDDLVISAQIGKEYACKHCKQKSCWILRCENKNGSKVCNEPNPQGLDVCRKCKNKIKCIHAFSLAHINLAQRMLNRNDEVTVGDRLEYIYVEVDNPKTAKNELAEDPKYAVKKGLKLNRLCYLEQVAKPILGLYRVCLQDKRLDDIIDYVNDKMVEYGGKKLKPSEYKIEDE